MSRTIEKTVYKFTELSDRAKDRARQWYREADAQDDFWSENVYEDADTCAKLIGIEMDRKRVPLMGGGVRHDPCIWYSGFSSQGDGACFEGRYGYVKGAAKAIRDHAPQDKALHAIADELQALQRKAFYKLGARMKHNGHYYHSGCMSVDVWQGDNDDDCPAEDDIRSLMRQFADWIYRQLETEYEYQNSDEVVDDNITANEYEFDEDGRII